jgi:hypothetical protein
VILGEDLLSVKPGSLVVNDPPSSTWVALSNDTATAIDSDARIELPKPMAVGEYQKIVAARYAQSISESEAVGEGAAGGGGPQPSDGRSEVSWMAPAGVGILAAGLLLAVILFARRRRADVEPVRDFTPGSSGRAGP